MSANVEDFFLPRFLVKHFVKEELFSTNYQFSKFLLSSDARTTLALALLLIIEGSNTHGNLDCTRRVLWVIEEAFHFWHGFDVRS